MASFWDDIKNSIGSDPIGGITNTLGLTSDKQVSSQKITQVNKNAYNLKNYDDNRSQVAQEFASSANRVAPTIGQVQINQEQANQARGKQGGIYDSLLSRYNQTLSGETPSLAEMLNKESQERALKQTLGVIGSQAGLNPALAARMGAQNMSMAGQVNAAEAAKLRVQEEERALQGLAATAEGFGGMRNSDLSIAQAQANLMQNANIQNQQAGLQQTGMNDALQQYYMTQKLGLDKQQTDYGIGYQQDRMAGSVNQANANLATQRMQNDIDLQNQRNMANLWGQMLGGAGSMASQWATPDTKFDTISGNALFNPQTGAKYTAKG